MKKIHFNGVAEDIAKCAICMECRDLRGFKGKHICKRCIDRIRKATL